MDVSEQVGRAACSNLQEEFNREDVIFTPTDVTDSEQLVSHSGQHMAFRGARLSCRLLSSVRVWLCKNKHEAYSKVSVAGCVR